MEVPQLVIPGYRSTAELETRLNDVLKSADREGKDG